VHLLCVCVIVCAGMVEIAVKAHELLHACVSKSRRRQTELPLPMSSATHFTASTATQLLLNGANKFTFE
jgi:hypothetical protein